LTARTTPKTEGFSKVLHLVQAAVPAGIDLIQIREKSLSANVLYQLCVSAARITGGSATRLLINDRADIAAAGGADGVHLTTHSLPTDVVRHTFGPEFLIGVSTHSIEEAGIARHRGADFVVFGPVFETASKSQYGVAQGVANLGAVCEQLSPFPILALGGVTVSNAADCIGAEAQGVAGISIFRDPDSLADVVSSIRESVRKEPA
jgi:thiamine-phosphate pyrophosphorylase